MAASLVAAVVATLSLIAWLVLLFGRGGFWRADQRLGQGSPDLESWPSVVAVIPARDEAPTIGRAVNSLLTQDYPGDLSVIVVDDGSTDGTAAAAGNAPRLTVVPGAPLPSGWTGKLWAVHQGLKASSSVDPEARYVLLTDADIAHAPTAVRRLVDKAEYEGLALASLMVRLHCAGAWERLLIPAFVFFFQKLYPFPWVNDPARPQAAAAGGCMLVRRTALDAVGGVAAIRDRLIDDCALAARVENEGLIWLGLSTESVSLRTYDRLDEIWTMVARTAYTQLGHSPLALIGTVVGMAVLYLAPAAAVLVGGMAGDVAAVVAGAAAWLLMAVAYRPTHTLYRQPPAATLLLPVAALLYTLMTIDSARRHLQGRGGAWKGRVYDG